MSAEALAVRPRKSLDCAVTVSRALPSLSACALSLPAVKVTSMTAWSGAGQNHAARGIDFVEDGVTGAVLLDDGGDVAHAVRSRQVHFDRRALADRRDRRVDASTTAALETTASVTRNRIRATNRMITIFTFWSRNRSSR